MSRLDHPELHLTFRDWSSSESEEDNDNNMDDDNNNNNQQDNINTNININLNSNLNNNANVFNRRSILDSYNYGSNNNNNNNNGGDDDDNDTDSDNDNLNNNNNNRTYTPPGSNGSVHRSDNHANNNDDDKDDEISYEHLFSIRNTPMTIFDNVLNDETDHTTYYNRDTNNNTSNNNSIENSPQDIRSIDNSNSSTPPHLLNGINLSDLQNINWIPSILNNDYTMRRNSSFSNCSFFKFHPQHEINYNIPNSMQKFGLINMMNELLILRNKSLLSNNHNDNNITNKKRNFNQFYFEDMNFLFLLDSNNSKLQQISKSSFLKTGLIYNLPIPLNNLNCCLKFTDVNYDNLNVSGLFQFGDIQLNFNGEIVDFLKSDLRFTKDRKFLIEGNIFSNLLRNKLIFSKKFNKLFDYKRKKAYKKKGWKPFSMNKMGYIISNKESFNKYHPNNNNKANTIESFFNFDKTLINPIKSAKFPNGSLFHKLQVTNESKFDSFKLLSKWFEMPPLNQFINTPSPPTPPNRLNKCTNNPENLLVCKDCVNLMISKFIFLKIEIDIHDLIDNKNSNSLNKVYPDLVYKHRRRFHDYANKLMSKSNNNFRRHLERQMREMPNTSIPIFGNMLLRYSSDDDSDSDNENFLNTNNINLNQGNNITIPSIYEESDIINDIDEYFNFQDTIDIYNNDKDDLMSTDGDNNENDEVDDDDNDDTDDDNTDNNFSDEEPSNYSTNSRLLDSWPLSEERFEESHPVLDPNISSTEGSEEDDFDNPYNIIFTNDRSRRVSRLLFNINMSNEQHRHKRSPVSSLNLYKNGNTRLKMILLLCINRNTGELHMIPGNMDVNLWSTEQNNGELFEDVETFNKVFKFFMEMDNENKNGKGNTNGNGQGKNNKNENKDSKYTKKLKKWMMKNRSEEVEEIKKLMVLQMLTNPSIINGFDKRRKSQKEKMEKRKEKNEQDKYSKFEKRVKKSTVKKKRKDNPNEKGTFKNDNYISEYNLMDSNDYCNNDIKEHILALMGENFRFDIDNDKVLTFRSEQGNNGISNNKQGNGTSFSFEFA